MHIVDQQHADIAPEILLELIADKLFRRHKDDSRSIRAVVGSCVEADCSLLFNTRAAVVFPSDSVGHSDGRHWLGKHANYLVGEGVLPVGQILGYLSTHATAWSRPEY